MLVTHFHVRSHFTCSRRNVVVGFMNIRGFFSSNALNRSYDIWSKLAIANGFSPEEVLDASTLGAYVVVDPQNKTALLALSPMSYQKLLGQCMSNETSLVLLFSPLDARSNATAEVSGADHKTSPTHQHLIEMSERLAQNILNKRVSSRWFSWSRGRPFKAYTGITTVLKDNWLSIQTPGVYLRLVQRWSTRLLFWSGLSRRRQYHGAFYYVQRHLYKILCAQGPYGLCLYLKASFIIITRYLAGNPVQHSFTELGIPVRLCHGLPHYLPVWWRQALRSRSAPVIRLILSILYIYKGIYAQKKDNIPNVSKVIKALPVYGIQGFENFCVNWFRANGIDRFDIDSLTPTVIPALSLIHI